MLVIRKAMPDDVPLVVALIEELAEFEQLRHVCRADEAAIQGALFGPNPKAYALIAEWAGAPAGFALYFYNFSTFLAKPGIYIEDVYIRPEFRRRGIARRLFHYLAAKAVAESCGRLEWSVLDWNEGALAAYRAFGAAPVEGWTVQRVTGEALLALARTEREELCPT